MVVLLLDFKAKLDNILSASFYVKQTDKTNEFQQALKDSFEKFINQKENRPAELTAKFIDSKLRTGSKGQTEEQLEDILERVLTIFRFIQVLAAYSVLKTSCPPGQGRLRGILQERSGKEASVQQERLHRCREEHDHQAQRGMRFSVH